MRGKHGIHVFYLTAEGALDQTHEHLEFGNDVERLFFPQLVKRVPQFRPGDESEMKDSLVHFKITPGLATEARVILLTYHCLCQPG